MRWNKASKRPRNNRDVLIVIKGFEDVKIGYYNEDLGEWRLGSSHSGYEVTHWMDLPEMPK